MSTLKTNTIQAATGTTVSVADGHTLAPPGHVIQVVSSTLTSAASGSGTSVVDTGLTATITPSSTSSKINVSGYITLGTSSFYVYCYLVRGSSQILLADTASNRPRVTIGAPIYAGGNGIIEYIGNNGGYGKYIRIRHNNEYNTAYAHLSNYKKGISRGVRVNQGDVIGFVGSTGNSTGPHLHYEIIYQDKHINPLKLKLPSGKVLQGEELERFKIEYKKIYANHLNLLYE